MESVPKMNPLTPGPTGLPSSFSPWTGYAMFTPWWVSEAKAGAAIASATMITMTARAIIETRSERRRRQVSCHWVRP